MENEGLFTLIFHRPFGAQKMGQKSEFIESYLQVNALSKWVIGIYLRKFNNNGREISIAREASECGIENFEFIASERV